MDWGKWSSLWRNRLVQNIWTFKITRDSKLQWLQFQTLHRILPTKYYLHILKLIEAPNCFFCGKHPETIHHLFVEFYEVKKLWRVVEDLFLRQYRIPITFDRHNIIFGKYEDCKKNRVPNLLIFIMKHYIFTCRFKTSQLSFLWIWKRKSNPDFW